MKKKRATAERYVRLTYGMMQSQAWQKSRWQRARHLHRARHALPRVGNNNGQHRTLGAAGG